MDINNIGILGTGTMGIKIATRALEEDLYVTVFARSAESMEKAKDEIQFELIKKNKMSVLENLNLVTEFSGLKDCELIVEALVEDEDVKKTSFEKLEEVIENEAILTSISLGISPEKIASHLKNKSRFAVSSLDNKGDEVTFVGTVKVKETTESTKEKITDFMKRIRFR